MASKGGSDSAPGWYENLSEQPEVEVQVMGNRFRARARTATEQEKPAMWAEMTGRWARYEEYQRGTERVIPVVVLERQ